MTLQLVPTWRKAYTWFSMWASVVLGVLVFTQTISQWADAQSSLALITHTDWYHTIEAINVALIPLLRLVHQPVVTDSTLAVAAPPVPSTPAAGPVLLESPMNAVWTAVIGDLLNEALPVIANYVAQAQIAAPPATPNAQKNAAVTAGVLQAVPAAAALLTAPASNGATKVDNYIGGFVTLFKALGVAAFTPSSTTPTATSPTQQPAAKPDPALAGSTNALLPQ